MQKELSIKENELRKARHVLREHFVVLDSIKNAAKESRNITNSLLGVSKISHCLNFLASSSGFSAHTVSLFLEFAVAKKIPNFPAVVYLFGRPCGCAPPKSVRLAPFLPPSGELMHNLVFVVIVRKTWVA